MAERQFTGKHALAVFVAAFGVIIAVNLVLAYSAVKTFPGLEVKTPTSPVRSSTIARRNSRHWAGTSAPSCRAACWSCI